MAVRIRMKRMGRTNRPFYRVVAVDSRGSRDGRVLEYLGHYDPMVAMTDARAILKGERIDYWLSVGAQPSDKVKVLIKKYGTNGTHLAQQKAAIEKLKAPKQYTPPPRVAKPQKQAGQQETSEGTPQEGEEAPALETAAQES